MPAQDMLHHPCGSNGANGASEDPAASHTCACGNASHVCVCSRRTPAATTCPSLSLPTKNAVLARSTLVRIVRRTSSSATTSRAGMPGPARIHTRSHHTHHRAEQAQEIHRGRHKPLRVVHGKRRIPYITVAYQATEPAYLLPCSFDAASCGTNFFR